MNTPSYEKVSTRQLPEGVLYTLNDCTEGPWYKLDNSVFDSAVSKFGTLTKQTEHQKFKGSSVYNENRYFIMQASGTMPDRIAIPDPTDANKTYSVRLGYKGKSYFLPR